MELNFSVLINPMTLQLCSIFLRIYKVLNRRFIKGILLGIPFGQQYDSIAGIEIKVLDKFSLKVFMPQPVKIIWQEHSQEVYTLSVLPIQEKYIRESTSFEELKSHQDNTSHTQFADLRRVSCGYALAAITRANIGSVRWSMGIFFHESLTR